jgi:hypothetical protein
MPKLRTLDIIPTLSGRRFSTATLGADVTEVVRSEHASMTQVVAMLLQVDPDKVTSEHVDEALQIATDLVACKQKLSGPLTISDVIKKLLS